MRVIRSRASMRAALWLAMQMGGSGALVGPPPGIISPMVPSPYVGTPLLDRRSIAHGALLSRDEVAGIAPKDRYAISFLLAFLHDRALPAQLYLTGGYVRDLLLGRVPNDLDVSLCLRDCDKDVSVGGLASELAGFAAAHPQLGVTSVDATSAKCRASIWRLAL